MERRALLILSLSHAFLLLILGVLGAENYSRHDFPPQFIFGSGTSAYQVEGAANEDGRTPSIWDTFAHAGYAHGENGDVACDGYHKYKEDVRLMVETGLDAYRFSISWSRLLPNGRGPVNPKGLQFYNNLINELISNAGIQPHVTLHNYDLPQVLEDEYGGWVSRDIIRDFTYYADVCFREFGDRVLYWTTINEPNVFAMGGYDLGISPPQRCSLPFCAIDSGRGNSTYEPYLTVHHILLAHSSAARLYRRKYKDKQHGFVGISVFTYGIFPLTNTEKDRLASQRVWDFLIGWIMEPLLYGDYPISMKTNAGERIPAFTIRESEQVKGSYDFIGVIHYTNSNVTDNSDALEKQLRDYSADMAAKILGQGDLFTNKEFAVTPWGLQQELNNFKLLYGNPPIFIHENGQRTPSNSSLQDVSRVKYLHGYIGGVLDALRDGSNIKGYFAWSFLDLFELLDAYKSSFGLYYVDRNDPELKRYPKLSAKWYSQFLKGKNASIVEVIELEKDPSLVSVGHLFG
ncbi:hydroxyisourate hydrolase isoform X1 [Cajanus cajan]|uniref:hydroxyisourate hydrolase isoform X1 n=1 Tax=Cajanus cajan TaxID=3821 RepID=UPI00098DC3AA|nr:hydroxyisourate hydrolase isoform X1 [Cajanus cajan]XP_020204631.1 hydroxyisourate hydrolase isoform X2 [Cajanus cajan]XP_029125448.1 hydroxyisourate hydrolase isoform X1 [Cajanus cajan]